MFTVFESSFRSLRCFSLAFASLSSYSHYFSVSFSSSSCCVGCGCGCLTENCIGAKYTRRDRNHLKRKGHFAKPDSREKVF